MSRTALDGFLFGDAEKEYLVSLLNRLREVYFTEILGFCCMGNHFHLLARMLPEADFTDKEIKLRSHDINRRHTRRGFFWKDRFKSVIVEKGQRIDSCSFCL